MFEIYTTGGGDYLVTTLNAVAAFFATGNARALVAIGLMLGMIILVFQVMFNGDLRMAIKSYVLIALVGALSIADRSDVIIFDSTKGPLWFRTVDNVPTSVAYIGSATSSVSHALTRQIEALFSPPDNIAYQRHGMLFGATLMTKTARWRAVTSVIHENLTNFMDQCVIDAVDLRYVDPDVVTRSGNLEATIGANMPASLAYYDTQTRATRSCAEGWPDIVTNINAEVDVVLAAQAASAFQGTDGAAAITDLRNTISDFATFAGYASTAAEDHIKQAMLIAAFDDAANRGISATGNAAALQHLQSARAEVQTRSSYQAVGANALSWVPYLKIVFENLYYGAFPIALALMMTPLCLQVIRGYFGGFRLVGLLGTPFGHFAFPDDECLGRAVPDHHLGVHEWGLHTEHHDLGQSLRGPFHRSGCGRDGWLSYDVGALCRSCALLGHAAHGRVGHVNVGRVAKCCRRDGSRNRHRQFRLWQCVCWQPHLPQSQHGQLCAEQRELRQRFGQSNGHIALL